MTISISQLAEKINATVVGDGGAVISSLATLEDATPGQLSFLSNPKYEKLLATTKATAVISPKTTRSKNVTLLRCDDPYYAFMQAMVLIHGHRQHPFTGIHPNAHIDPTAKIAEGCTIYPGAYVGPRATLGQHCTLYPNAVVYDDSILHDRVTLHAGAVIGVDGFGYATHAGQHHKIPQIGIVELMNDVEIGANVTIQRATLGKTTIGAGTKIDDLSVIGHGTTLGDHALIVSLSGIAGSAKIGHHLILGGQAGIAGHLTLGNHVSIAARAAVASNFPDKTILYGAPATPAPHGRKAITLLAQLPEIVDRIKKLEKSRKISRKKRHK